ncbi:MAG: glycoside hydrolase family 10 protein, partial [Acutalibacteraceae bacterium]
MKRIFIFFLTAVMFTLCSCSNGMLSEDMKDVVDFDNAAVGYDDDDFLMNQSKTRSAVWLSYLDLTPSEQDYTKEQYAKYIDSLLENAKKLGVSDVFVHAVSFSDAIYPSEIYPSSTVFCEKRGDKLPFDALSVIIERAKKLDLKVHAWINPYRIQSSFDSGKLCETETAFRLYQSGNGDVVKADGGLYYNPASERTVRLVTDAVRELLSGYDLAGIHIDDYFYPPAESGFDEKQYEAYQKSGGTEPIDDWRRENVNKLVRSIYNAVKDFGDDKLFSISPSGDIEKNRSVHYADVTRWLKEDGYCDVMIPQIYYGFLNESQPFEKCLEEWENAACGDTRLWVGLALYKIGK